MKINTILLTLSLFVLASCSTIHKNGYYQTKRYSIKNDHSLSKSKSSKTRAKERPSLVDWAAIGDTSTHAEVMAKAVLPDTKAPKSIIALQNEKTFVAFSKNGEPPAPASPNMSKVNQLKHRLQLEIKDDIQFIKKDLRREPGPNLEPKVYNTPSVVSFGFIVLNYLLVFGANIGALGATAAALGVVLGLAAIILAFIGWSHYKKDRDKYMGKFFIYFSYVYAWIQIILLALLLLLLVLLIATY